MISPAAGATPEEQFEAWSRAHKYDLVAVTGSDDERTAIARFAWLAAWSAAQQAQAVHQAILSAIREG